jgi:gliding motility-associated-like protein
MKRQKVIYNIITLFVLFLFVQLGNSQNLVLNPSFEITTSNCANFGGEGFTTDLVDWDDANSGADSCSSPDLFSTCNIFATVMPNSILGYQYSRTGTRHAGFISHEALDEYREYIEGKLSSPLVAGQTYCVSFYVSLANDVLYATDNIGMHFFNSLYQRNACPGQTNSLINITPHLNYDCGPITDTTNWVRLQWDYVATGGEQFFVIGNFFNNANTTIVNNPGGGFTNPYAYYFVDDVSVIPSPCCFAEITETESFCINDPPQQLAFNSGTGSTCASTITGTWNGNGVNASGLFDPALAGVGSHVITLNTNCGFVATTTVVVSPCQNLEVCRENDGTFSVSNGVAAYNWEYFVPATSTPITTQAQCQACGYTWFFGQCLNGIQPVTACSTPATWTSFATGQNVTISGTPNQIRVTDASGTSLTFDPATIPNCNNDPCPTISISSPTLVAVSCFGGNNGSVSFTSTGGVGTINYLTQPGNIQGSSLTNLTAQTYTVTATDQNSCAGTYTFTITQPLELTATTTSNDANCGASDGLASIAVLGGTAPYVYNWTPNLGSGPLQNNISSGIYTVQVVDAKGCSLTREITVNSINGPVVSITNQVNVTCFGGNNASISVNVNGGNSPYTFQWQPSGGTSSTANGLPAGNYTCTVRDNLGCLETISATVTQPSEINISSVVTNASCGNSDGQINLSVSGGTGNYTFNWLSGQSVNPITNLSPSTYIVIVKDQSNCEKLDTFIINTTDPIVVSSQVQSVSCAGLNDGSATLNVSGGAGSFIINWLPGNLQGVSQQNLNAGSYTVTITDADNCSWDSVFVITEPNAMNVNYNIILPQCGNSGSISFSVSGGNAPYQYFNNGSLITTSSLTSLQDGDYLIEIKDQQNCSVDSLIKLFQTDSVSSIIVPNVFTPNGDKINDLWEFKHYCISQINVELYNRWGNLITSYDGLQKVFDGKLNGNILSQGVYFYKINVKHVSGKEESIIGYVTLQF